MSANTNLKGNEMNISCSPGTFHRVVNDDNYRQQVTDQVLAGKKSEYSAMVYSLTDSENVDQETIGTGDIFSPLVDFREGVNKLNIPQNTCDETIDTGEVFTPVGDFGEEKHYWSDAAIKLMLACIEDLQPKVGKSIAVKTRAKMYGIVAQRMAAENYTFSADQIENKFRGMERQYKKTVLNNRQTGRSKQTCSYEKELSQLLGNKKGISPEYCINTLDDVAVPSDSHEDDTSSDIDQALADNTPSCSSQAPKRRKTGPVHNAVSAICQIRDGKEHFQSKVLQLLQKKEERAEELAKNKEERAKAKEARAKAKEERAKERDERSKAKLELLEKLLNKLKE